MRKLVKLAVDRLRQAFERTRIALAQLIQHRSDFMIFFTDMSHKSDLSEEKIKAFSKLCAWSHRSSKSEVWNEPETR